MRKRVSRERIYLKGRNQIALFVVLVAIIFALFTLGLISDLATFIALSVAIISFFSFFIVDAIANKSIYLESHKGKLGYLRGFKKEIIYYNEGPKAYWRFITYLIAADIFLAVIFLLSLISIMK